MSDRLLVRQTSSAPSPVIQKWVTWYIRRNEGLEEYHVQRPLLPTEDSNFLSQGKAEVGTKEEGSCGRPIYTRLLSLPFHFSLPPYPLPAT